MKKLIIGLYAALFLGFDVQSQNFSYTKSAMVVLVEQSKKTYEKGMTYKDFVSGLTGNAHSTVPTLQEDKLLKDLYGFVSMDVSPETVSKEYNGQSLLELAQSKNLKGILNPSGSKSYGFLCQLLNAILASLVDFIKAKVQHP